MHDCVGSRNAHSHCNTERQYYLRVMNERTAYSISLVNELDSWVILFLVKNEKVALSWCRVARPSPFWHKMDFPPRQEVVSAERGLNTFLRDLRRIASVPARRHRSWVGRVRDRSTLRNAFAIPPLYRPLVENDSLKRIEFGKSGRPQGCILKSKWIKPGRRMGGQNPVPVAPAMTHRGEETQTGGKLGVQFWTNQQRARVIPRARHGSQHVPSPR